MRKSAGGGGATADALPALDATEHPPGAVVGIPGRAIRRGIAIVDVLPGQLHVAHARVERDTRAHVHARAIAGLRSATVGVAATGISCRGIGIRILRIHATVRAAAVRDT